MIPTTLRLDIPNESGQWGWHWLLGHEIDFFNISFPFTPQCTCLGIQSSWLCLAQCPHQLWWLALIIILLRSWSRTPSPASADSNRNFLTTKMKDFRDIKVISGEWFDREKLHHWRPQAYFFWTVKSSKPDTWNFYLVMATGSHWTGSHSYLFPMQHLGQVHSQQNCLVKLVCRCLFHEYSRWSIRTLRTGDQSHWLTSHDNTM